MEEASSEDGDKNSVKQKVGNFYISGMDTAAMNKRGLEPVKPFLNKIDGIKSVQDLVNLSGEGYKEGNGFLFGFDIGPDDKISTKNAIHFVQSGTGLPTREYYFNMDTSSKKIREAYTEYISKLLVLAGEDNAIANKSAKEILSLETKIASSHSNPTELRDPIKNYNKYALRDFKRQMPEINFDDFLKHLEVKPDTILIGQPQYYKALNKLLKSEPLNIWKTKYRVVTLDNAAPSLSKPFRDAYFEFYNKVLNGQTEQNPRWKQMVNQVDDGLGELLGELYVEKHFPKASKERMLSLVNNLQKVYRSRISKLDWMSPETKERALAKLDAFIQKIGYPDKWKKYDEVEIKKDKYFENLVAINKHDYKEKAGKLGKEVDKTEWQMTPPTVNAYYNPSFNEIVFPAGILKFPFFDIKADDAVNYGAIGAVIGHEMTHGFDDQGRQFNKDGNLADWWTAEDSKKFKAKAKVVVGQYNKFTVLDSLHINGELTLGENIADIGGVAIAYEAFKLTEQGKGKDKIDGFTGDQRFFLSFAQVWRLKYTPESIRLGIASDTHSPEQFRVNGPFSNMPEFYKAFNIKAGDRMYREKDKRVRIW